MPLYSLDPGRMYEEVIRFVGMKLTTVVSWLAADGSPRSAVVFFWLDHGSENQFVVYFVTRRHTRLCQDLQKDPRVAMVIGAEFEPRTMQIEGTAQVAAVANDLDALKLQLHAMNVPPTQYLLYENSFFQGASRGVDYAVFKVTATWARYMDFNRSKHDVTYYQIVGNGGSAVPEPPKVAPPTRRPAARKGAKKRR